MRKKILTLIITFLSIATYAQEGNKNYIYCELVRSPKAFSSKINIRADFGQETSYWKEVSYLKDKNGKAISFNSMVDAMNYFGKQGWEFVQAYVIVKEGESIDHWLLKKEISSHELDKVIEEIQEKK